MPERDRARRLSRRRDAHLLETLANHANPLVDEAPVRLELGLARPTQADPSLLALQMRPSSHQPVWTDARAVRELHLELAFEGTCTLREDVEDEGAPVEDPALDMPLEVALLRGAQRPIEEDDLGPARLDRSADLVGLAGAHEELRIRASVGVAHGAGDSCPGRHRELSKLVGHAFRAPLVRVHEERPFTGRGSVEHRVVGREGNVIGGDTRGYRSGAKAPPASHAGSNEYGCVPRTPARNRRVSGCGTRGREG